MAATYGEVGKVLRSVTEATAPVEGQSFRLPLSSGDPRFPSVFAWEVLFSGTITTADVDLEGSNDDTNWHQMDTNNETADYMRWVTGKPVQFVRANVKTFTGTTPKATVNIVPNFA